MLVLVRGVGGRLRLILLPIVVATFSINVALIACVVVLALGAPDPGRVGDSW